MINEKDLIELKELIEKTTANPYYIDLLNSCIEFIKIYKYVSGSPSSSPPLMHDEYRKLLVLMEIIMAQYLGTLKSYYKDEEDKIEQVKEEILSTIGELYGYNPSTKMPIKRIEIPVDRILTASSSFRGFLELKIYNALRISYLESLNNYWHSLFCEISPSYALPSLKKEHSPSLPEIPDSDVGDEKPKIKRRKKTLE